MVNPKLKAEKRKVTGRKVKKLRREGILPANIYGKKAKSLAVQVALSDFLKTYKEAGETGLVDLQVDSQAKPVLIHHVQLDPITDIPIHADFLQVNLKEKVTATVPVEISGEAPAAKSGVGILVQQILELEVEALPTDLPEKFVVDVSRLENVDDAIKVADLPVDKAKVKITLDPEQIVVKIEPPAKEEEVAPPPTEEAVPAEGAPAEGAEAPPTEAAAEEGKPAEEKPEGEQPKAKT